MTRICGPSNHEFYRLSSGKLIGRSFSAQHIENSTPSRAYAFMSCLFLLLQGSHFPCSSSIGIAFVRDGKFYRLVTIGVFKRGVGPALNLGCTFASNYDG